MFGWIEKLPKAGRFGGAISAILGLVVLAGGVYDLLTTGDTHAAILGFGLGFTLIGILLLVSGIPAKKFSLREQEGKPKEALLKKIENRSFPFVLCMKKHDIVETQNLSRREEDMVRKRHKKCKPRLDHIEISSEEDLHLALTSLK